MFPAHSIILDGQVTAGEFLPGAEKQQHQPPHRAASL